MSANAQLKAELKHELRSALQQALVPALKIFGEAIENELKPIREQLNRLPDGNLQQRRWRSSEERVSVIDFEVLADCIVVSGDNTSVPCNHPFGGHAWVDQRFDTPDGHVGLHPR